MMSALRAALLAGAAAIAVAPVGAQAQGFFDQLFGAQQQRPNASRQGPRPQSAPSQLRRGPAARPAADDDDDDDSRPQVSRSSRAPVGPAVMDGGGRPAISPASPPVVSYTGGHAAGSVVIDTGSRALYYVLSSNRAYRYPIAVGRIGFTWTGTQRVSRVASWPDWHPPAEMRQRQPGLPVKMTGGIRNPLGAKAIYLGNTLYRIHGTNDVRSIGTASSSGCFRMTNSHVTHLSTMVGVGTAVHVMRSVPGGARRSIAASQANGGRS